MTFSAPEVDRLQDALGHHFGDPALLQLALTHRSWIEERYPGGNAPSHLSQQRLEFLGDAFFGSVVARWVFDALATAPEGVLTKTREEYTKGVWLSAHGANLGLARLVRCGRGEQAKAADNRRLMEDTMEAIIGALLIDAGPVQTTEIIRGWLPGEVMPATELADPVSALNEWFQARYRHPPPDPEYAPEGLDHERIFACVIRFESFWGDGTGRSKKEARKAASAAFLRCVREQGE